MGSAVAEPAASNCVRVAGAIRKGDVQQERFGIVQMGSAVAEPASALRAQ